MKWNHLYTVVFLVYITTASRQAIAQGLHVTISLDTPGPPHQAATWIQLTCLAPAAYHQYFVTYDWTFYCTHRGSEPLGPPLHSIRNDPTIFIRSTPTLCFDTAVCTAHDLVTNTTGQASWIVGPVTGIGLWGTQPMESHTAFEADSLGQIGSIYCHSSSNKTNVGHWFAPDGRDLTNDILDIFSVQLYSGEGHYSYSTLGVLANHQLTSSDHGAYTCQAPDNNGNLQETTLWMFQNNNLPRHLELSFVGRTSVSPFTLSCDTAGLPPTAVHWSKGSATLNSGGSYDISKSHSSNYTLNFTNKLVIDQPLHQVNGIYSCTVISILRKPSTRNYERFDERHYMGVYTLGSSAGVTCTNSDPSAVRIQWERANGSVVSSSGQLNTLATDAMHHVTLYCHVYNISNSVVGGFAFKFIVNVPESILTVQTMTSSSNPSVSSPFTLSCRAAITASHHALTFQPIPSILYQNGSAVQNGFGIFVVGPRQLTTTVQEAQLTFDYLRTSHANVYLCSAFLSSPALEAPLVKEHQAPLTLQLPLPSLVLSSSHPPPYYAGSQVTLTCEVTTSSHIDTSIVVDFTWTVNGVSVSTRNTVTVTNSQIGQVYRSMLSFSQLNQEQDSGLYHCSVRLRPVGSTAQYLTASETTNSSVVEIDIRVQSLLTAVTPSEVSVLDISPHNVITINCTATDRDVTTIGTKTFSWWKNIYGSSSSQELVNGIRGVSVTNINLAAITSSSMLVTLETVPGNYEYICQSIQRTASGTTLLATGNATSSVMVKGPANPAHVTAISATVLTFSTARIMWTVPTISYTQETYTVLYQTQHSSQQLSSSAVSGSADLSTVNRVFSLILQGLEDGVTYNYRIRSVNTVGRVTVSPLQSFMMENSPAVTVLYASDLSSPPTAGQNFTLVCEAVVREGTLGMPRISWLDGNSQSLATSEELGIYLSTSDWNGTHATSVLTFQPLRVALSQDYVCRIEFAATELVKTHRYNLQVIAQTIPVEVVVSNTTYLASHPLTLICNAQTGSGTLTYSWQSNCRGACFTENQSTKTVSTPALASRDTGMHTCIVTDSVGNTGNASISISVTGVGMFSSVAGTLVNNSYMLIENGDLGMLQCLSGTAQINTGHWIAPNGDNFTSPGSHPFRVVRGGAESPGSLEITLISGERFTTNEWLGVYSCRMLNEQNELDIFYIGIYISPSAMTIASFESSSTPLYSVFTMNCTSTGSVATSATWYKDDQVINPGFFYDTVQILRDGVTSTYDNLLLVFSFSVSELPGVYRCEVSNSLSGSPTVRVKEIHGLRFTPATPAFELGSTSSITCSSDLGVNSIEWLDDNKVVQRTEGNHAELMVHNVSENDHSKEFICRSMARFGVQEKTVTMQVEVSEDDLTVSIERSPLEPVLGMPFSLICTATKDPWLTNQPTVDWYHTGIKLSSDNVPDGGSIQVDVDGQTVTSTLSFSSLNDSHSGEYECEAHIVTSAIPGSIQRTAAWTLAAQEVTTVAPPIQGTPCTFLIQLLLSEVKNCQDYRFEDQVSKVEGIVSSVVKSINRNGYSACAACLPLTVDDFKEPMFDCDSSQPTSVLFRVKVETNGSCDDIRNVLNDWVKGGAAAVTINFNTLRVNSNCPIEIASPNAPFPNCGSVAEGSLAVIGGGAGAAAAVLIFFVIVVVVCIICCLRVRKKRLQSHRGDHSHYPRERASANMYAGSLPGQYHDPYSSDPHKTLPPVPTYNRHSGDSYIYMRPLEREGVVTEFYDDASCKKDLGSELYDEIPGQYYEAVYNTPTGSEAEVSTFKQEEQN